MEDDERATFRRALGMTLQRVRRKLTKYRSQQSIATVLHVDKDTVGRWERGEGEPQASELVVMWQKYDVPAEWLMRPTSDINVLDRRIAVLRRERQTRADHAARLIVLSANGKEAP